LIGDVGANLGGTVLGSHMEDRFAIEVSGLGTRTGIGEDGLLGARDELGIGGLYREGWGRVDEMGSGWTGASISSLSVVRAAKMAWRVDMVRDEGEGEGKGKGKGEDQGEGGKYVGKRNWAGAVLGPNHG
jgi:hypothetical protein